MLHFSGLSGVFKCGLFLFFGLLMCLHGNSQSYLDKDSVLHNPIVYVSAGGYSVDLNTSLRLDTDFGLGTSISLEDDLKLDDQGFVFRTDAFLRVKKRSQFAISYTSILRRRNAVLEEDVTIRDTTFYVGANLDLYFDTYYYALTWRYSVFNKTNWNAGFSFGLRYIQFKTGFKGALNSNEGEVNTAFGAPAVLIGLHGSGYLTPRLLGRYSFEYFQLSIEGIDLRIIETRASLEYYIFKNVGLGVSYSTNKYLVKDIPLNDNFVGKVNFDFEGFSLLLTGRF